MNPTEFYERGGALLEAGDTHMALAEFSEGLKLHPASAILHNGLGVALLSQDKLESAIREFNEAIRLDPEFCKPYANRGLAFHRLGEFECALANFDQAVRLDPAFKTAIAGRGRCLIDMERYEAAIEDFSKCIELEPESEWAWAMRGLAHHYLEMFDEALEDFDRSVQLDATDAWTFNCRGCSRHAAEEYESAINDYDEAIRIDPKYANAYLHRGRAYCEVGELDRAISDYCMAINLGSEAADPYYYRAKAWREKGELKNSLDDLTEVIRLDLTFQRAFELRARIWDELGEPERADQDLDRADALATDEPAERNDMQDRKKAIYPLLQKHFDPTPLDDISITERRFPARVRADLQRAIDRLVSDQAKLIHFCGVRKQYHHEGINFSELLIQDRNDTALSVPPQYEEVDIGEEQTVKCLKDGLWLLQQDDQKFALFLEPPSHYGRMKGIRFQVATVNDASGTKITDKFFKQLEKAVFESACYRGKILSLELHEHYSGVSTGITVHRLKSISREQVILPRTTLELLERNVIQFVAQRPRLNELGIPTKKGLLFYGPPGTGKTHTIHYLAGALEGHTTLLVSAEQVGLLSEYMTMARLLQPSVVVLEDVDLIARDRMHMNSACEEVLLNKLLNEMDGLQQDAEIFFVLTTNRPEALEAALASRPGRIDQAIEFPLPDADGRAKLVRLYSYGVDVPDEVIHETVKKTEGTSAAFIKELMRRATQFQLERAGATIELQDVDNAIEELLFSGGTLNRKLLGANVDEVAHKS